MKRVVALLTCLPLGLAGCSGPSECCLVNTVASAVVQGRIVDASSTPLANVEVHPAQTLVYQCEISTNTVSSDPPVARTDAEGFFSLELWAGGPGHHCVDFQIRFTAEADTTLRVEVPFALEGSAPDTTFIELVFNLLGVGQP